MLIFGGSGDLTRRLLVPALYNLACDRLLPDGFAIVGVGLDEMTDDAYRARMSNDIRRFSTRTAFDEAAWADFVRRLHYVAGSFDDPALFSRLLSRCAEVGEAFGTGGNLLYYYAVPPSLFGPLSDKLDRAGGTRGASGWRRVIVEKPFGHDLPSAIALSRELLSHWSEDQIYRIDHYLGKETVQNLLAFRFANGMFEPLWNRSHVDHVQLTVAESVGVEGRGGYYDKAGVLRDMVQNHMFQMLAYLMMEPPTSFSPDAIRDEKAKLLEAVRVMRPEDVPVHTVRGQYGPGRKADGREAVGYRQEPGVPPESRTETFCAMRLYVDNWRWEGVPVYLRSGKALGRRGTELVVQFKKAPERIFRDTPEIEQLGANRLVFHIQPDQGIELRFDAKQPGPTMRLQGVNMRFDYKEAFEASRAVGYEVLLYACMLDDPMLFARSDAIESAWRIAQPMIDAWSAEAPADFPNYPAGSWGPKGMYDLIEQDGRKWLEAVNRSVIETVPLFASCDAMFQHRLALVLTPDVYAPGDWFFRQGDAGREMYFLAQGQVEVVDERGGKVLATLGPGSFFGELSLLLSAPRNASVRALSHCDVFILDKSELLRVLRDHPHFARSILDVCKSRYDVEISASDAFGRQIHAMLE